MQVLSDKIEFPDPKNATSDGLLAIGGDLSPERLICAYKNGIFPWFQNEEPILWWAPDPRFVLFPEKLKLSKSMKQTLRNSAFTITTNKAFNSVIKHCANIERKGQSGTWITPKMINAYCKMHELGYAVSVEVWQNDKLVGGLYGIDVGNGIFCGESMFSLVKNASKEGLVALIQTHDYKLIDCQVYTKHLESLGAEEIPRNSFINLLK